jgi:hypothetical protein
MEPSARGAGLVMGAVLFMGLLGGGAGCNMNRFNANMTAGMFKEAGQSLDRESDLALAREAAPGLLKTIDGMAIVSPENRTLLALSAQGYCSYAFGFLEDDLETLADGDPREAPLRSRTSALYHRCADYGLALLRLDDENLPKLLGREGPPPADWQTALAKALGALDKDAVPGLFWTGLGLASEINLNRDDLALVAELPKVELLMQRVVALDAPYYNAGAHLALGLFYASRAKAMGGDPERGRKHIELAIAATAGKFLLHKVYLARIYAVTTLNRPLYEKTLDEVLATPGDVMPTQRLANEIARKKAARYRKQAEDLF